MKVAIIADLHGNLPTIPTCDLLIIAGDLCGGPDYVDGKWRPDLSDEKWWTWLNREFMHWLGSPIADGRVKDAVVIAGNHDTTIQANGFPPHQIEPLHYLQDSGCNIGGYTVWGTPWIPKWDNLALNLPDREGHLLFRNLPRLVDILVSHSPPQYIRDRVTPDGPPNGLPSLTEYIKQHQPLLVACGHIHEAKGITVAGRTRVFNAAGEFVMIDL